MQDEVAEKEREAKSKKRLQEVANTARDEATARATKATQDHERAFTRANPAAAALVRMMCIPPDDVWIQLSSRTDGWNDSLSWDYQYRVLFRQNQPWTAPHSQGSIIGT